MSDCVHRLRTLACYWDAVESGKKRFEVRRDDRGFQCGDIVEFVRVDPDSVISLSAQFDSSTSRRIRHRIGWG